MKENHKLALIVSFYLSKYDREGLRNLEYSSFSKAFESIGSILNVKKNSIKNMRDEFDPIHDNNRVGWYQRELRPSRRRVVEAFGNLSEISLREIIKEIISNKDFIKSNEDFDSVLKIIDEDKIKRISGKRKFLFVPRGPTGKKAEEFFIKHYKRYHKPVHGELKDMREYGCGYDFKIQRENSFYVVEVKGLAGEKGCVSFTDKEWRKANELNDKYYVAIVKNLQTNPSIHFINNPGIAFNPERNIYKTLQISWIVKDNQWSLK